MEDQDQNSGKGGKDLPSQPSRSPRPASERCSVCRQSRPIVKRLAGATITGSMLKRRSPVLVCADCDSANAEEYRQSQRRFATEQIALIDQLSADHPDTAHHFQETREKYVRTLQGLGGAL